MSCRIVRPRIAALIVSLIIATSTAGIAAQPSIPQQKVDHAVAGASIHDGWSRSIFAQIERDEYQISTHGDLLEAPNRANNLRTRFHADRIEVGPRMVSAGTSWGLLWRTTGWGRGSRRTLVADAQTAPHAEGAIVRYSRAGLEEWYRNTPRGLEQGFTIRQRPEGTGDLRIEGVFEGSLYAVRRDGEQAIDLVDSNGVVVLRYAELQVTDADGADLPVSMELAGRCITLRIDDALARYPVTIDPLFSTPSWTAEADQASAQFGASVWTAGDVDGDGFSDVLVGVPYYDGHQSNGGKVYLYRGSSAGLSLTAVWSAEGEQASALFGSAIGPAGDVNGDGYGDVIIAAPSHDGGQTDEGRVYVFHGSPGGLGVNPAWTAESNQAGARFGAAVAPAGDVNGDGYDDIIIGATDYDNGESNEGRAFVYCGSSTGLGNSPAWTAESNQANGTFGCSVSTAGDINGDRYDEVIVGCRSYDNGQTNEGRAYLYYGSSGGLAAAPSWVGEGNLDAASYGYSVAAAGDMNGDGYSDILVGSPGFTNGQNNEGRAYGYFGSPTGIVPGASWFVESDQASAYFGAAVASAGDVDGDGYADVIIGAYAYDDGEVDEGRAYIYCGSSTGPGAGAVWTAEGDQSGAWFGVSVGTAGDVDGDGYSDVIVGAAKYDNGQTDEGRAYLFNGYAQGLAASPAWAAEGNQASCSFSYAVATAGDVNGDGYSDVIVGAPLYDGGQQEIGRVWAYLGSPNGLPASPSWTAEPDRAQTAFGASVACAGDVNGDGYSDVIVGAAGWRNPETSEGAVFVYLGSAAGLSATPSSTLESDRVDARFGKTVAGAGDVNGDGYSDILVGAEFDMSLKGAAYLFLGSRNGLYATPSWTIVGDQDFAAFGSVLGTAGDINRDGFSDIIIAAPSYNLGQGDQGKASLYLGSITGVPAGPVWTAEGVLYGTLLGSAVGTAGDVNGDGYSDVIVGSPGAGGRVDVYYGSEDGIPPTPSWTASCDQSGARFGEAVETAGDVNGDGYSDIIVGAYAYDTGQSLAGRLFVYQGGPSGLAADPAWTYDSSQQYSYLGWSVAMAGDVNGDGFSDVIVGERSYDGGEMDEGRALVFLGNRGQGLDRAPRQMRVDQPAPIWTMGVTDRSDAFRVRALARTAMGRGNVRLQCETKPLGTPFDGQGLISTPPLDTGAPTSHGSVVELTANVTGLQPGARYHWRARTQGDSPLFPYGHWVTLPYNGSTEADLVTIDPNSGVDGDAPVGRGPLLGQPIPNPCWTSSSLAYTLSAPDHVHLGIFDAMGREVKVLVDRLEEAGAHSVRWDLRDGRGSYVPAGVYIARLQADGGYVSVKLIVVRSGPESGR